MENNNEENDNEENITMCRGLKPLGYGGDNGSRVGGGDLENGR